jgi:flagellar operon protein
MQNNQFFLNKYISTGRTDNNAQVTDKKYNNKNNTETDFSKILKEKVYENESLKFSKHASLRMESRNISLTEDNLNRINEGINKAASKGVNDSLIIMDKMAFIVNINSKTVVTAVNNQELKDNVFTNIDGAVIV